MMGKKVLFVIASNNFRDEEFFEPKQVVETRGGVVTIASSSLNISKGVRGAAVKPDILLNKAKAADYDAIVFVGGAGSSEYWNDPAAHQLAKETAALGKVVGAICIAPVTLANAGLLNGKKATVFPSEIERLKAKGAVYTGAGVEIDGKIITGNGPQSATLFGEAIVAALQEKR
ncbi:DJ-1/PfpI family protein [Candidatus Desantisbacteria bacterium]|nr:DJ-1/PfpI family protein [Candidatus Desantisbacteria bacterium]